MSSFVIIGGREEERKDKALAFAKDSRVSKFDTLIIEPSVQGSIGIPEIRNLKTKLLLRPFNSKQKLAILLNFEKATLEAQNAFLKTLEEPPDNTIIVLTSPNTDLLLPTLVSRCQVIQLVTSNQQLATSEFSIFNFQFSILVKSGVGERLKLAQDMAKTREEALAWLEKMIITTRQKLLNEVFANRDVSLITQYLNFLISFQKTHTQLLTTNVNPRFALENCFLNLKLNSKPPSSTPGVGG